MEKNIKNIFKNAYFGKAYKTRDGRMAIYHMYDSFEDTHFLILNGSDEVCCNDEGIDLGAAPEYDIISEWEKPINEEKLNNLAEELNPNNPHGDTYEIGQYFGFDDGFKAGYKLAKKFI